MKSVIDRTPRYNHRWGRQKEQTGRLTGSHIGGQVSCHYNVFLMCNQSISFYNVFNYMLMLNEIKSIQNINTLMLPNITAGALADQVLWCKGGCCAQVLHIFRYGFMMMIHKCMFLLFLTYSRTYYQIWTIGMY